MMVRVFMPKSFMPVVYAKYRTNQYQESRFIACPAFFTGRQGKRQPGRKNKNCAGTFRSTVTSHSLGQVTVPAAGAEAQKEGRG
jgi:hypothetical protein